MNRAVLLVVLTITLLLFIGTTSAADTRVLSQRIGDCENGTELHGTVTTGEKVEVKISVLIAEEKQIVLFTELQDSAYYLEESKISENSSLKLTLQPGTHTIRLVGIVPPTGVVDGQEITLLGCDNLGRYITARIISPYILKNSAYTFIAISGASCAIIAGLSVFLATKGKLHRAKSLVEKKYEKNSKKTRMKLKTYLEKIAPSLTVTQKKEAKILMKELGEISKWQ